MKDLFKSHIEKKLEYIFQLLESKNFDSLVIDAGSPDYYFLDDQPIPFRSNPHFLHLCPDAGEGHVLQILKNKKPTLFYYSPDDFWHEVSFFEATFWSDFFDVKIINSKDKIWNSIDIRNGHHVCVTPNFDLVKNKNLVLADESFISALHWLRIEKSEYEILCIKEANKVAALGHLAARDAFFDGLSERQTYQAYLNASNQHQLDLPYGNIIAFNEKSAILHYQNSRDLKNGNTFLIDAGAKYNGYCSDITRTYYTDSTHPTFKGLFAEIEESQKNLCLMVKPGFDYQEIHEKAHDDVAQALINKGLLKDVTLDDALDLDLTTPFFPHGIGHPLGIQVHDVGGKQLNEQGESCNPNEKYPFLRTLREIKINDVLTIEPGLYFIPILLNKLKEDRKKSKYVNWSLIDELIPFGGIRIEDNVVARPSGPENLTRPFLPN